MTRQHHTHHTQRTQRTQRHVGGAIPHPASTSNDTQQQLQNVLVVVVVVCCCCRFLCDSCCGGGCCCCCCCVIVVMMMSLSSLLSWLMCVPGSTRAPVRTTHASKCTRQPSGTANPNALSRSRRAERSRQRTWTTAGWSDSAPALPSRAEDCRSRARDCRSENRQMQPVAPPYVWW